MAQRQRDILWQALDMALCGMPVHLVKIWRKHNRRRRNLDRYIAISKGLHDTSWIEFEKGL